MYNNKGRYALMAVFVLAGLVCVFYNQYQLAAVSGLLFAFVVWSHFKHSSVLMASKHFKNNEFGKVKALLAEVAKPERLAKSRRGYYEFMQGNMALKEEEWDKAEYHFQLASRFPVGGKNEKAYVLIHLANLALRKKDRERAEAYTKLAKELAETQRSKDIIVKIEKEISKI
ncbi:hypothetical protein G7074_04820 [Pedobacter sp. HDW13]|uniref:hypothetical protein n=1 Tax=unclassified Pedobacter TaxID=2628915 RepID=UPI000F5B29B2|nr:MULTISPECIES: hypothetical protein [unclassified Pedobacter]QIL38661.1 hypothetical protein G7074_04820 [Pedobacter sp. HDW13]RQO80179.1 hypothetical protein DBR40_00740 [Pedobacter sp. KBW01]